MKIAFVWNGVGHYEGGWKDGLWAAMKRIEEKHDVKYFKPYPTKNIKEYKPDWVIYWAALTEPEAPSINALPFKKALCFAGGPIENPGYFDVYFYESIIDGIKFKELGKHAVRAFGVNEELYKPKPYAKMYRAMIAGTFALWKRHDLFAKAVGSDGIAVGIKQDHEKECYEVCEQNGVKVLGEQPRKEVAKIINESRYVLNPASFWGGGQRLTLEAMACDVEPIVMEDSPKNAELVSDATYGYVTPPNVEAIQMILARPTKKGGRKYIESKWTSKHYADAIEKGLGL